MRHQQQQQHKCKTGKISGLDPIEERRNITRLALLYLVTFCIILLIDLPNARQVPPNKVGVRLAQPSATFHPTSRPPLSPVSAPRPCLSSTHRDWPHTMLLLNPPSYDHPRVVGVEKKGKCHYDLFSGQYRAQYPPWYTSTVGQDLRSVSIQARWGTQSAVFAGEARGGGNVEQKLDEWCTNTSDCRHLKFCICPSSSLLYIPALIH